MEYLLTSVCHWHLYTIHIILPMAPIYNTHYFFSFLLKQKFCHLFLSIIHVTEIYTNFCLALSTYDCMLSTNLCILHYTVHYDRPTINTSTYFFSTV